jgi:SPP1 family holin
MKKDVLIRTVILAIALVNQILTAFGKSVIPIDDETITQLISVIFTIATSVWAWWKNNSITPEAIVADEYLKELNRK